jgi:hypothetical protein
LRFAAQGRRASRGALLPERSEKIRSPEDLAQAFARYPGLTADGLRVKLAIDFSGSALSVHGTPGGRRGIVAALREFGAMFSVAGARLVTLTAWAMNPANGDYEVVIAADVPWDRAAAAYEAFCDVTPDARYGRSTDIVPLICAEAEASRADGGRNARWLGILTDGQTADLATALAAVAEAQPLPVMFGTYGFGPYLARGTRAREDMDALDDRVRTMGRGGWLLGRGGGAWDSWQLAVVSDYESLAGGAASDAAAVRDAARAAVAECVAELPKQLKFLDARRRRRA